MEWMTPNGESIRLSTLAKHLGVSYGTVSRWVRDGRLGVRLRVCQSTFGLATSMQEYESFLRRISEFAEASEV